MEILNIIKIGGSVITDKNVEGTFRCDVVKDFAKNVPPRSIVIHGSGVYGKPPAVQYGYLDGIVQKNRIGAVLHVRQRLSALNALFVDTLLSNGVAAFGISASLTFVHRRNRVFFTGDDIVSDCLERGIVPVIYSDFIFYRDDCLRVLSSDKIIFVLASRYKPANTVFATDVDGVFKPEDGPRHQPRIFDYLDATALGRGSAFIQKNALDVTGGMYDKIQYALRSAMHSKNCIILNGYKSERIREFCSGTRVIGTRIGCRPSDGL